MKRRKHLPFVMRPGIVMALVAAFVAGSWGLGRALAQDGEASYTFPLSGVELSVDQPWTIDRGATVDSDDANVAKLNGETDNVLIGYFPAGTDVEDADAAMVGPYADLFEGVEVVESGSSEAFSYGLNLVTIDGRDYGVFSLYTDDGESGEAEAVVYIAPVAGFGAGLDDAKAHIALDGDPIFGGVEGEGVQDVLAGAAGTVSAAEATGAPLPLSGGATPVASPAATPAA